MSKNKVQDKVFQNGNKNDGKHYWLTPDSVYDFIDWKFGISKDKLYDPCPYPKPDGYDGLIAEWGDWNYVNPPFGVIDHNGKKIGATAWFRKAQEEVQKGKKVFFVFPIHNWLINMMVECDASVINLGNVKWLSTEDNKPGKGCGSIAMFLMGIQNPKITTLQWNLKGLEYDYDDLFTRYNRLKEIFKIRTSKRSC
jgi:hypothetical protein